VYSSMWSEAEALSEYGVVVGVCICMCICMHVMHKLALSLCVYRC
jgi:hypothetical protein